MIDCSHEHSLRHPMEADFRMLLPPSSWSSSTAYSEIDWTKGFDFLDSELQQVTREAETGKRIVDKLVKVYLRNGKENWILIHIEIQNQKEFS